MQKVRLGVIGPGLIWDRAHRDIVRSMSNRFIVTAFSARSEKTRSKAAQQFPEAEIFADYRELIESETVDAVVVLTPIPLNAPVAMEVLRAEKHAVVEKPMATSVSEAKELITAEAESSGTVYILEQFPHKTVLPEIRTIFQEEILGRLLHFEYVVHNRLEETSGEETKSWGDTRWRQEAGFPLGNIYDGGIHDLSFLQFLFGPPRAVVAAGSSVRPSYGRYDTITSVFTYPEELLGTFSHSGYIPGVRNYLIIRGSRGAAEITAHEITIRLSDGSEEQRRVHHENESVRMWREIAGKIETGSPGIYSTRESLADIETLSAIEKSLEEGRRITP